MGNMHGRIYMRLPVHLYLRGEVRRMTHKYCLYTAPSLVDTRGLLASSRFEFARRYHSPKNPSEVVTSTSVPGKLEFVAEGQVQRHRDHECTEPALTLQGHMKPQTQQYSIPFHPIATLFILIF